ncbi:MAG: ABC transporter permease [Acidobacteriota bacterium]
MSEIKRRRSGALWENIRMAIGTLRAHKLRSFLTILGIFIGIATVITMTALIRGLNARVSTAINNAGPNLLLLRKFNAALFVGGIPDELANRKHFRPEDVDAIRGLPEVLEACPIHLFQGRLSYRGERTQNLFILGTTSSFLRVRNAILQDGRFLTRDDVNHRRRVVVLAMGVVEALFPHIDPIGKRIRVEGEQYEVVGTLERQENLFSTDAAQYVLLPQTTFENQFGKLEDNLFIDFVPPDAAGMEPAIEAATQLLRIRRKVPPGEENDFAIMTQKSVLDFWGQLTNVFFLVMVAISSIGLMVGGIGVMNIMLVSVTERTREIGIRKAIGARRRDILLQFLVEAATLTAIGGFFGILIGGGIAKLVAWFTFFPASTPLWTVLVALGFSTVIGLIFGTYPATRAARLDPIEALRYE